MYVTLFPCNECAKAIIQAGIKTLVYDCDKYASTPSVLASKRMLDSAGVRYFQKSGIFNCTADFLPPEQKNKKQNISCNN